MGSLSSKLFDLVQTNQTGLIKIRQLSTYALVNELNDQCANYFCLSQPERFFCYTMVLLDPVCLSYYPTNLLLNVLTKKWTELKPKIALIFFKDLRCNSPKYISNLQIIPVSLSQFLRCFQKSSQHLLWILSSTHLSLLLHRSGSIGCSWEKIRNHVKLLFSMFQPDWLCHCFCFPSYIFSVIAHYCRTGFKNA